MLLVPACLVVGLRVAEGALVCSLQVGVGGGCETRVRALNGKTKRMSLTMGF